MNILLAIDGSRSAQWAGDYLRAIPLQEPSSVHVVSVVEDWPWPPSMGWTQDKIDAVLQDAREEAHRRVEETAGRLRERWPNVRASVADGWPAEQLLETIQADDIDLVVLGARGQSEAASFRLGGVAQKVATHAPCSVLIVKRQVRAFRRVLVALDGSEHAQRAVRFVQDELQPDGLDVSVLYVWDRPVPPPSERAKSQLRTIEHQQADALKEAGFKARGLFEVGHPVDRIVEVAEARDPHLIVMGSRGLTGWKQILLGSVSQRVIRYSTSSVLIVRERPS